MPVDYPESNMYPRIEPAMVNSGNTHELINGLMLTKANHWKYEAEWRIVRPKERTNHYYFPMESLTGIIVGCQTNLAIADLACFGRMDNGVCRRLNLGVCHDEVDLELGQRIRRVFASLVDFGMAPLVAASLDFHQRHPFGSSTPGRILTLPPNVKAIGNKAGLGSPANPQPRRQRYVTQASRLRVLAASLWHFWW